MLSYQVIKSYYLSCGDLDLDLDIDLAVPPMGEFECLTDLKRQHEILQSLTDSLWTMQAKDKFTKAS